MAEGNCQVCHDGHRTKDADGHVVLKTSCTSCHDVESVELKQSHSEFRMAEGSCGECHDPHVGTGEGLLRANVHPPFVEEDCSMCHEAAVPGREVRLVASQEELCSTCHELETPSSAGHELHPPYELGECTSCHAVHAAADSMLLRYSGAARCSECHTDVTTRVASAEASSVHAPVASGECNTCHGGHAGVVPGVLAKSVPDLCADCHGAQVERSQAANAHAPARDGQCLTCHDPHVGEAGAILTADQRDLCGKCHELKSADFITKHRGFSAGSGSCSGCHDPHGSGNENLANDFQHAPYEEGSCDACHLEGNTMAATGVDLCVTCHSEHEGDTRFSAPHAPLVGADGCVSCHEPHTSRNEQLLIRETTPATCMACHERERFVSEYRHPDVTECSTCHAPHGSEQDKILVDKQVDLCMTCHDDAREQHTHAVTGPAVDPRTNQELTCTSCHDPHSSSYEMQLTHEKSRELCVQCHRGQNLKVRARGRFGH